MFCETIAARIAAMPGLQKNLSGVHSVLVKYASISIAFVSLSAVYYYEDFDRGA